MMIKFGKVTAGSEAVRDFFITEIDNCSANITSIESDNSFIKAETVFGGVEKDKNKKVKVTLLPGLKPGKFSGKITVYTDNEKIKQMSVAVSGEVMDIFTVQPKQLSFGGFQKGKRVERAIEIKSVLDRDFKITNVSVPVPEIETRVETVKEAREYRVVVALTENLTMERLNGTVITINTDDEIQRELEVSLLGIMKK